MRSGTVFMNLVCLDGEWEETGSAQRVLLGNGTRAGAYSLCWFCSSAKIVECDYALG